ncbi:hypothetical protein Cgig2_017301 [Carnegiea gigantea]|uniref:sulfiredoxin n=1 Tax=Carnegiea gigantea TaxID=171969 RepID=A0A9Q1QKX1_9CARY|nr:hypothetical protein Cgig2_017301 [Carnegiea gigantea]
MKSPSMASFYLRIPAATRSFLLSASSNGAPSTTQQGGPVILELPLDKIRRPLMRARANDPQKVKELMDSIKEIGLQVPIDVLEVDGVYYVLSSWSFKMPSILLLQASSSVNLTDGFNYQHTTSMQQDFIAVQAMIIDKQQISGEFHPEPFEDLLCSVSCFHFCPCNLFKSRSGVTISSFHQT